MHIDIDYAPSTLIRGRRQAEFAPLVISERDIKNFDHISIHLVSREAGPSKVNAVDFIVASANEKFVCLKQRIEEVSMAVDDDPSAEIELNHLNDMLVVRIIKSAEAMAFSALPMGRIMANRRRMRCGPDLNSSQQAAVIWETRAALRAAGAIDNAQVRVNIRKSTSNASRSAREVLVDRHHCARQRMHGIFDLEGRAAAAVEISASSLRRLLPSPTSRSRTWAENICIDKNSRVAILGANGTSESMFMHLITGALQLTEGSISKHAALKLAKYSQRRHGGNNLADSHSRATMILVPISQLSNGLGIRVVFARNGRGGVAEKESSAAQLGSHELCAMRAARTPVREAHPSCNDGPRP
ncbi:hypothetical protein EV121DRAFT_292947 [Schizophyllum commune]